MTSFCTLIGIFAAQTFAMRTERIYALTPCEGMRPGTDYFTGQSAAQDPYDLEASTFEGG